jgi:hypothetical protein
MILLVMSVLTLKAGLNTENSTRYVGGYRSTTADSLIIGPNAVIIVDGIWEVFSRAVWIHPTAQITGNGVIRISNPSAIIPPKPASSTYIDGNNGNFLDVNIQHNNPDAVYISDAAYSVYPYTNPPASLAAALKIGRDFDMIVDGADVYLNAHDFIFDSDATISGYRPERMVITGNSISGHMVKQDYSGNFIYPVGISDGDYTPASVNNTDGINTIYVSVQDYNNSISIESYPDEGIYRTWHIFADVVDAALVNLQHNDITEGSAYSDNLAFVTRYEGFSPNTGGGQTSYSLWDYTGICNIGSGNGTMTTGPVLTDATELSRRFTLITNPSLPNSYYTKSICDNTPLPVSWLKFEVVKKNDDAHLSWLTASELNCDKYEIEHTKEGGDFKYIGEVRGNGTTNSISAYDFYHQSPGNGIHLYRIKQIDYDGTYSYSSIRQVEFDDYAGSHFKLFPNPTTGVIYLQSKRDNQANFYVRLYSTNGMLLIEKSLDNTGDSKFDIGHLPAGMYILLMTDGKKDFTEKVVLSN